MEEKFNEVTICNCNNISEAKIIINDNCLNLKFAPNGTGKSTIARALFLKSNEKDLSELHSYGIEENPTLKLQKPLGKVFIFDEDFVNNIVFKESEVIERSFEVFIKTSSYDNRLNDVHTRLSVIKIDIGKDEELKSLRTTLAELSAKIQFNTDGAIKNNPFFKSIISKQHLYKIPENLLKFKPFFDTEYTVEWVDWKNKGFEFDAMGECPFCTEKFVADYQEEKETFTSTYSKASAKNLKEFLGYFQILEEYITPDKYRLLNECVTSITDEAQIRTIIEQFIIDVNYIKDKIEDLVNFDSYKLKSDEITELGNKLFEMKITYEVLNMLRSEKTLAIITTINTKIETVLAEINDLKHEVGELKRIIQLLANNAKKDINGFLESAGINYELVIEVTSEIESKTVLKYKDRKKVSFEVDKIKKHLSWGERNAFALVLFMHYALSKEPDLIILDDPISSFNSDKKYAIINRLFRNTGANRSLYKQTVLLMTHDLEPVIDFVVNNKPTGGFVYAYHLNNRNGIVFEKQITDDDLKSQIHLLASIIKDVTVDDVHRIISLRKLIELTEPGDEKTHAYNICSCLLHAKSKPDKKINHEDCVEMSEDEIALGTKYIIEWIPTFSYDLMIKIQLHLDF